MIEVGLFGTCNNSTWRDEIIKQLKDVNYFNPVVKDWTPEAQQIEIQKRVECDILLYVITPKMTGVYSIAELVESVMKRPETTYCVFLKEDGDDKFDEHQLKSIDMVKNLVILNNGKVFDSLKDAADFINYVQSYLGL